jgi:hypothetical protein
MMARTRAELMAITDDELIAEYDRLAAGTVLGLGDVADELARRDQKRQNDLMLDYTKSIKRWTVGIGIATLLGLATAVIALVVALQP